MRVYFRSCSHGTFRQIFKFIGTISSALSSAWLGGLDSNEDSQIQSLRRKLMLLIRLAFTTVLVDRFRRYSAAVAPIVAPCLVHVGAGRLGASPECQLGRQLCQSSSLVGRSEAVRASDVSRCLLITSRRIQPECCLYEI